MLYGIVIPQRVLLCLSSLYVFSSISIQIFQLFRRQVLEEMVFNKMM